MDRNQAKEFYPIMQAFAEGKSIEFSSITDVSKAWREVTDFPLGMIDSFKFRIKPEPKYRPFKDAEECWAEMCKHHPFGWIKTKQGTHRLIVLIDEERLMMGAQNTEWSYRTLFNEEFTFVDGLPFGVKVEE